MKILFVVVFCPRPGENASRIFTGMSSGKTGLFFRIISLPSDVWWLFLKTSVWYQGDILTIQENGAFLHIFLPGKKGFFKIIKTEKIFGWWRIPFWYGMKYEVGKMPERTTRSPDTVPGHR
jgi:hypothetical protein